MHTTSRPAATLLLALAALTPLAACGGRDAAADSAAAMSPAATDTGVMAPGTAAGSGAMMSDPATGPQFDSLTVAARGGVMAMKAAVPLIQRLEDKLDNSNDPALTDIAKDFEKLREELADDTPDAPDIANILERVGPKLTTAAANAGPTAGSLRELGQQLGQAATQLRAAR